MLSLEVSIRKGIIILITCIYITMAVNVLFPFLAFMVEDFGYGGSKLGIYAGILAAMFCAAQLCSSLLWGMFSDAYGRRPALVLGTLGAGFGMLVFGMAETYTVAVVGRLLSGVLSGNLGVVKCYLAEITTEKNRGLAFSYISLGSSIGTVVGPLVGGLLCSPRTKYPNLIEEDSIFTRLPYLLPSLICVVLNVLAAILCVLYMEETRFAALPASETEHLLVKKTSSQQMDDRRDIELNPVRPRKYDSLKLSSRIGMSGTASIGGFTSATVGGMHSNIPDPRPMNSNNSSSTIVGAHTKANGLVRRFATQEHVYEGGVGSVSGVSADHLHDDFEDSNMGALSDNECDGPMQAFSESQKYALSGLNLQENNDLDEDQGETEIEWMDVFNIVCCNMCSDISGNHTSTPYSMSHSVVSPSSRGENVFFSNCSDVGVKHDLSNEFQEPPAAQRIVTPRYVDAVTHTTIKRKKVIPVLRQRDVVMVTANYGILALAAILLDETIPLMLKLDVKSGGFGFSTSEIGVLFSISGMFMIGFTLMILPGLTSMSKRFLNSVGTIGALLACIMWPVIAQVNSIWVATTLHPFFLLWPVMIFIYSMKAILTNVAYTGILMQVNHSVYVENLGQVNGLGQSFASLARAIGPAFGGALWSLSYNMNFVVLNFIIVALIFASSEKLNSVLPSQLEHQKVRSQPKHVYI